MARQVSMDRSGLMRSCNDGNNEELGLSNGALLWRLFALGMLFLFYLCVGASVFSGIESPLEQQELRVMADKKARFLQDHSCVPPESLESLLSEVVEATNRGVTVVGKNVSVPSWSFGQSFFFASTIVTTIGYGHQTPLSSEGKLFCMVYAMVGIPLTLILLSSLTDIFLLPHIRHLLAFMHFRLGHRCQPHTIAFLHFGLVVMVVSVVFFVLPAIIFALLEHNWNTLDALYYCFISLTTIGLGDFIPGDTPGQTLRPLYKALTSLYLLAGVTAMMVVLSVFYSLPNLDSLLHLRPDECLRPRQGGYQAHEDDDGRHDDNGDNGEQEGNNEHNSNVNNNDNERIRLQTTPGLNVGYNTGIPTQMSQPRDMGTKKKKRPGSSDMHVVRARSRPDDDDDDDDDDDNGSGR